MSQDTISSKKEHGSAAIILLRGVACLGLIALILAVGGCNLAIQPAQTSAAPMTTIPESSSVVTATVMPVMTRVITIPAAEALPITPTVNFPMPLISVNVISGSVFIVGDPAQTAPGILEELETPLFNANIAAGPMNVYAVASPQEAFRQLGFTPVELFFATDRLDIGADRADQRYANRPGPGVNYGTCIVTIPDTHRLGELETPGDLWFFQFPADPRRHVILSQLLPQKKEMFFAQLDQRLAGTQQAFVFIHGYNTTFEDAARRTAQIAYDLDIPTTPLLYSWPSRGALEQYWPDEDTIQLSTPHIKDFLAEVSALTNAKIIHLIAHSMGNRGLTWALVDLTEELSDEQLDKLNQIVLAAADINAELFKQQIAPQIASVGEQITIYSSSTDLSLQASRIFHGYRRLGEAGDNLVVVPGLYTIDASNVHVDFINHAYPFGFVVLGDLLQMFRDHAFPWQRPHLEPVESPDGTYWQFQELDEPE